MSNTTTKKAPKLELKKDLTSEQLAQLDTMQAQFDTLGDQFVSLAALGTKTSEEDTELLGLLTTLFILRENLAATIVNNFYIIKSA